MFPPPTSDCSSGFAFWTKRSGPLDLSAIAVQYVPEAYGVHEAYRTVDYKSAYYK